MDYGFEYLAARQSQLDHAILAGQNEQRQDVYLTAADRSVHTYVCGVSGSGKSRFLQNLLFQDISKGHPVCLVDPMGDLYRSTLEFVASGLERSTAMGFERHDLLSRYLFLDGTDPKNPLRINPLEPDASETSEQQVDDLMRALERLFEGKLEEQRRLRNVLRGVFFIILELNRLPEEKQPRLPGLASSSFPLQITHAADILNLPDEYRQVLLNALPDTARLRFHRQYFEFLGLNSPREQAQFVQSSWNVLQYLLADDLVLRVFDTERSTLHLGRVLREGKSLFCFLPKNENLAGARFLGKFITTKLQHAAYRRPETEWRNSYYLYLDEFHQFVDQAFADALTNLRKFGLRAICAHQSQSQPPFDTTQGQSLLQTITANSRIKTLFRLDRPDAERMSKELFELSQQRRNFQAVDHTVAQSEQMSRSIGRSSGRTTGSGRNTASSVVTGSGTTRSDREDQVGDSLLGRSSSSSTGFRRDSGTSEHTDYSTTEQSSESRSVGASRSTTTREVYYSMEGERELLINELQRLDNRHCYLSTAALEAQLVQVPYVPDEQYAYVSVDLPARILELQREHVLQERKEVRLEPVRLLPAERASEVLGPFPAQEIAAHGGEEGFQGEVVQGRIVEGEELADDDPFLD